MIKLLLTPIYRLWNKIETYICNNMLKSLSIACGISILVPIVYNWSNDMPEWFPYADVVFTICVNASYSIIASYLFYIINFYLPYKKRRKDTIEFVGQELAKIEFNFKELDRVYSIPFTTRNLTETYIRLINPHHPQLITLFGDKIVSLLGSPANSGLLLPIKHFSYLESYISILQQNNTLNSFAHSFSTIPTALAVTLQGTARMLDNVLALAEELSPLEREPLKMMRDCISYQIRSTNITQLCRDAHRLDPTDLPGMLQEVEARFILLTQSPTFPEKIILSKDKHFAIVAKAAYEEKKLYSSRMVEHYLDGLKAYKKNTQAQKSPAA